MKVKISYFKKSSLILFALLGATSVYATDNDVWHFNLVPYFWAVNVDGNIEVGVPAEGIENQLLHISENYSSILKHIQFGGMLDVNVEKGKFGLFVNAMFVNLKGLEVTTSDGFEVQVNTKFGIYSAGALYRAYEHELNQHSKIVLAPYVGARYTNNKSSATLIEAPEYGSSYDAHWTEPIIGVTLLFDFNQYWSINLAADVGILKKQQDSYNLIGLIGYKPINHVTLYLGYRQFYQSFVEGSASTFFEWKMHISGPILGVAIGF